jgi:glycosyltransferase 2 family protein
VIFPERIQKNWYKWLPGIIISLVVIIALAFVVDWAEFWVSFREVKITTVISLALLSFISLVFRSLAWRSLLENRLSVVDAFFCENIGYLLNNLLPFRLGELARAAVGAERAGTTIGFVLPSIMMERLIDIGFGALTLLIALPFIIGGDFATSSVIIALLLVVTAMTVIILFVKFPHLFRKIVHGLFGRFPKIEHKVVLLFDQVHGGLQSSLRRKSIFLALFWLILTWAGYWASFFVAVRTVAPQAPFIWALFVGGVVSLGIAVPSAPGNIGVFEAAFVGAMAILGVEYSKALAGAITMHLVAYLVTGTAGIAGIIIFGESFHSIMMKVKKNKVSDEEILMGERQ